jgi:molybdate transport system substrate-binding protein
MSMPGKIAAALVLLVLAMHVAARAPAHAGIPVAHAGYPVAPDVVVFCEPTLRHALTDVGSLWRSQTGIPVRVFTSPTRALLEQIAHHARDDVLIGESDAEADAATGRQLIKPETLRRLWRNQLVVAALETSLRNASSGSSAGSFNLAALAGKAPIAIVDPWAAVAGADTEKALQSLGLWQAVSGNSIGVVGTADAAFLLEQGKVKLAVVYATDVAADPDFAIADKLPAASYQPVVYWVALTEHALSPNSAKFVAFLDKAQAQQQLHADGLEVLP